MEKRERVLKAFSHEEADKIPIFYNGFEKSGTAYADFLNSKDFFQLRTIVPDIGDITEQRFFNVDCAVMDPFSKIFDKTLPSPPEFPDCRLSITGTLKREVLIEATNKKYKWYIGPYFKEKEVLLKYWELYGKPTARISPIEEYNKERWQNFCSALENYFYPMASLEYSIAESLFEGIGLDRCAYYMKKDPQFIRFVINEYTQTNIEVIKRLAEIGVDIFFFYDDLGQKGRTIFSYSIFKEFLLPAYRAMFQVARRLGVYIIQHSCGYITPFVKDLVDAGLHGLQSLEPAAGVDLKELKETYGDRLCLFGGIDSSRVLNFGTEQDVFEEVKRCVKSAAKSGGYVIGPSHNILNAPWPNVLALREAIEKYRNFPISF